MYRIDWTLAKISNNYNSVGRFGAPSVHLERFQSSTYPLAFVLLSENESAPLALPASVIITYLVGISKACTSSDEGGHEETFGQRLD